MARRKHNQILVRMKRDMINIKTEALASMNTAGVSISIMHVLTGETGLGRAAHAMQMADEISGMILFHKRARKNGTAAMAVWEDD